MLTASALTLFDNKKNPPYSKAKIEAAKKEAMVQEEWKNKSLEKRSADQKKLQEEQADKFAELQKFFRGPGKNINTVRTLKSVCKGIDQYIRLPQSKLGKVELYDKYGQFPFNAESILLLFGKTQKTSETVIIRTVAGAKMKYECLVYTYQDFWYNKAQDGSSDLKLYFWNVKFVLKKLSAMSLEFIETEDGKIVVAERDAWK